MVAARQMEFPYHTGSKHQRRQVLGALGEVIGRIAIPDLIKSFVLAPKDLGVDLAFKILRCLLMVGILSGWLQIMCESRL